VIRSSLLGACGLLVLLPAGGSAQGTVPRVGSLVASMPVPCADSALPPPGQVATGEYRPPLRRQIAVPPLGDGRPPRGRLGVEFLVNARGVVDSVAVVGDVDSTYQPTLLATLRTHTFWPAVYRGCAVPARVAVDLTFP
jgi:hypothetical protein